MILTYCLAFECPVSAAATDPVIRVLLTTTDFTSRYHSTVTVAYHGREITYEAEELKKSGITVRIPAQKDGIVIRSVNRQSGSPCYAGSLEIIPREEGILLVNELSLEKYLTAVVPSEMPASYAEEALKAQAVCARTYAWKQIQEHRLDGFEADVDDSVSFQVYGNVLPQTSSTEAVKETEGQILCKGGEPVEAYYFSTSAGITSTDEIWGVSETAPYLQSVPCLFDRDEPWSGWKTEIPWEQITAKSAEITGKNGEIQEIRITTRNESGAVTGLEVLTETGDFTVRNEYEIRQFLAPMGCCIIEKDGTQITGGSLLPSAYFDLKYEKGQKVSIEGKGYGHGVGMSQTAANRMAEQGYDYREILDYFFRNVTIENLG